MLRQFRSVIAIWKCERLAGRTQFGTYFCETLFDLREGPLFRFTCEDGVCHAVGADSEAAPSQSPRLLPGHWPELVRFARRCESIMRTGAVQAFGQQPEGKIFQCV